MPSFLKAFLLLLPISVFSSLFVLAEEVSLSPKEAFKEIESQKAIVVDIREKSELGGGVAKDSLWFPFSKVMKAEKEWNQFVKTLPKEKVIVFYCARGGRASRVVDTLSAQGFKVANIGGFIDWKKAGLPVSSHKK